MNLKERFYMFCYYSLMALHSLGVPGAARLSNTLHNKVLAIAVRKLMEGYTKAVKKESDAKAYDEYTTRGNA